jgi:hypothetical protein
MAIQSIIQTQMPKSRAAAAPASSKSTASAPSASRSETPPQDEERLKLLATVRLKLQKGFYNSDAVLDDLSNGFAKAFDALL